MFETRFDIMPQAFVVVGCGGTGSRLVPLLAQFIKTCQWVIDPVIFLVDDDKVEEKNLLRQNFINQDVGKYKAEVLATRYARAYNINIIPITKRVKTQGLEVFSDIYKPTNGNISGNLKSSLIISCVDSMAARLAILSEFNSVWNYNGIFLDSGNEDTYGQVLISNPYILLYKDYKESTSERLNLPSLLPITSKINYIPIDLPFYTSTQDKPQEKSCADLDQTMAINALMATTMFGVIQNILYSRTFNYYRLNVSLSGTTPVYQNPNTFDNMSLSYKTIRELAAKNTDNNLFRSGNLLSVADYCYQLKNDYSSFLIQQKEAQKKAEAEAKKMAEAEAKKMAEAEKEIQATKEKSSKVKREKVKTETQVLEVPPEFLKTVNPPPLTSNRARPIDQVVQPTGRTGLNITEEIICVNMEY